MYWLTFNPFCIFYLFSYFIVSVRWVVALMNEHDEDTCNIYWLWTKSCTLHCESKRLDLFSFEHNFGKYCPILITLLLLQTEINYDQVRSKIYHHAPSLLVHYPVKWTKMYWPTLLVYDFVIKDATVKQVTQISIKSTLTVSSEAVVVVSSFSVETHSKSSSPLVNSFVKNRLFKRSRHRWSAVQFIHTMDLSVSAQIS